MLITSASVPAGLLLFRSLDCANQIRCTARPEFKFTTNSPASLPPSFPPSMPHTSLHRRPIYIRPMPNRISRLYQKPRENDSSPRPQTSPPLPQRACFPKQIKPIQHGSQPRVHRPRRRRKQSRRTPRRRRLPTRRRHRRRRRRGEDVLWRGGEDGGGVPWELRGRGTAFDARVEEGAEDLGLSARGVRGVEGDGVEEGGA